MAHSDDVRAKIAAALASGEMGVMAASRAFGVPKATVSRIKRDIAKPIARGAVAAANAKPPKKTIKDTMEIAPDEAEIEAATRHALDGDFEDGDEFDRAFDDDDDGDCDWDDAPILEQTAQNGPVKKPLDQLIAEMMNQYAVALHAQSVVAADPNYIRRQKAEQLAILHGVMADKFIRILEAAEAAKPIEPEAPHVS